MPKERAEGKTSTPIRKRQLGNSPVLDSHSQSQQQNREETKANPRSGRCAIYITSTEKKSCADIHKDLTFKVKSEEVKAIVRNPRPINNGGVLLELEKRSEDKEAFQRVIQENLGKQYKVKGLTPSLTLEIGRMTCVITEER